MANSAAVDAAQLGQAGMANSAAVDGAERGQTGQTGLMEVPLTIRSATGEHRFTVEVAQTAEEQQTGLMFRTALAPDRGMIFPYDEPADLGFWMKNTLIPLDMIFIRADGTIARVAANTVPQSLETVTAGEPVTAVLEIAGGRAAELGIRAGDVVSWPR